ncbi:non-lysosomal glucosylceramidase isoform X2 [Hydra vulgaris]|uniref:Non-lysosomal glucosylceramidase isoform X2 n=2 Tax=Hydra vulgaris TaxID=6087 RepID=A0ABM4C710_HYDVU
MEHSVRLKYFNTNKLVEDCIPSSTTWEKIVKGCPGLNRFKYLDEEGDLIMGTTDSEWSAAIAAVSKSKSCICLFPKGIDILEEGGQFTFQYSTKSTKVNGKDVSADKECAKDLICQNIQNMHIDDPINFTPVVNPTLSQFKYSGEALRAVELPLGALGGGCISIGGDGGLRQWQINNRVAHDAHAPNSFFAIKIDNSAVVLQSAELYDDSKFHPSPYITDHFIPGASRDLLKELPGVKSIEITAKFPVVEVAYTDDKLKGFDVHLEAFSPKVPLDSTASSTPVIIFEFYVKNTTKDDAEVSLLSSLQNIAGWDCYTPITNQVYNKNYGGNTNSLYTVGSLYGIDMSNVSMKDLDAFNGHVSIMALSQSGDNMSTMLQYSDVKDLWNNFIQFSSLPGQGEPGTSKVGQTYCGAINMSRKVPAGSSTTFTFLLGWHFPNRYKDWDPFVSIPNTPMFIGTHYSTVWKTIIDVINYTVTHLADLRKLTYNFRDSMFNSTLPWQLIDSAAGRVSVLNSQTFMWHMDGYMYAFEGCYNSSGSCPLNCTHVLNFEMALAFLYPDLERTMREIDLLFQITPHGVVPSRSPCPLELRRLWTTWENYSTDPASCMICVDGELGTVLKTYREIRQGASKGWFNTVWNPIKLLMNRWLDVMDTDKNGMIYGPQPNTYDVATYGYSTLIGLLYLCALRATEEMAKLQNDMDFAKVCRDCFNLGTVNLDKACFTNGKWYTHVMDPAHPYNVLGSCTFIGGMYGQWWAYILNLGYLLPQEHIKSHLKYTYTRNFVPSFDPKTQSPRAFCDQRDSGWVIGVWDDGTKPASPLYYTSEIAWSGVIYPFAAMLIEEGLTKEGLDVLEKTRYFYDGTRRSPWNEIECGDHYARPLSSFALFHIASGQSWSYTYKDNVHLGFHPKLNADDFCGFFVLGTCWGTYKQQLNGLRNNGCAELKIAYGELKLSHFELSVPLTNANVSVGTTFYSACANMIETKTVLTFEKVITLRSDDVLTIDFKSS